MLIASVAVYNGAAFTAIDTALLIQAAMLVAGISTLIQRYPVWRIGSRLPVVMGLSFTFLSAMMSLAAKDYSLMIGAVIVGGCVEGLLGLSAKYWRRFVSPIVSACVVTTIGFSLLSTGISSFASSSVYPTGAWQNLLVAVITLAACLVYNSLAKGFWKQLYVLFGLIVGYVVSLFFGMVDFASMKATVQELGVIALPRLFAYTPKFEFGAIIVSGVTMLGECGFDRRNTIIAATSFAIGIGVTQVPEFFSGMPQLVSDIFAGNPVAGVFVVAMVLSLTLPKKIKAEDVGVLTEETIESSKPEQE